MKPHAVRCRKPNVRSFVVLRELQFHGFLVLSRPQQPGSELHVFDCIGQYHRPQKHLRHELNQNVRFIVVIAHPALVRPLAEFPPNRRTAAPQCRTIESAVDIREIVFRWLFVLPSVVKTLNRRKNGLPLRPRRCAVPSAQKIRQREYGSAQGVPAGTVFTDDDGEPRHLDVGLAENAEIFQTNLHGMVP